MPNKVQKPKAKAQPGFKTLDFFREKSNVFRGQGFKQKVRITQHKG